MPYVHLELVDLGEDPTDGAVPAADEDAEGIKMPEEPEAQARPAIHEVEDLGGIEQLLEASQELDALIVPGFGVDEDQERRAALRTDGFPRFVRTCSPVSQSNKK